MVSSESVTSRPTFRRSEILAAKPLEGDKQISEGPRYIIIQNKVYDVQEFIPEHPGGSVILTQLNTDASDVFESFHPEYAREILANYYVGDLVPEDHASDIANDDFAAEVRNMRALFRKMGYYDASKLYFFLKTFFVMGVWAVSMAVLSKHGSSFAGVVLAAGIMGFCWQQAGWLVHDFSHHQVFADRKLNNIMGAFTGTFISGLSSSWWKDKHNIHHSSPNVHKEDPDIDVRPLIALNERALDFLDEDFIDEDLYRMVAKFNIRNQAWVAAVVLVFTRPYWALASLIYVLQRKTDNIPRVIPSLLEKSFLAAHWAWLLAAVCYLIPNPLHRVVFCIVAQCTHSSIGVFPAVTNHTAMASLSQDEAAETDFFTKQVTTGRDLNPGRFIDFFLGSVNYHIEHHLFPSMPRHNLSKTRPYVMRLCKKYGIDHHTTSIGKGLSEVFTSLSQLADMSVKVQ
jgi:acyl-lipid Delta6-acetylenase / acyl-lipid (9-3)-desaturase